MSEQDRATLKQAFATGQSPTGSDFANLIDSFLNLAETSAQTVNSPINFAGGFTAASLSAAVVAGGQGAFTTLNSSSASVTNLVATTTRFTQIEYANGGTVTQTGEKTSAVTLNAMCGTITMSNALLTAQTSVTFALKNTRVAATDAIITHVSSSATAGAYVVQVSNVRSNSARLSLFNLQASGTLSEAVQIRFAILKATNS